MDTLNWAALIGQAMGIVAVILGFVSYQMHTQKGILLAQAATALAFCVHYLLIGATSGVVMNALAIVRNIAYYYRDKPWLSGRKCPIFFAVLMAILGAASWQGAHSLFIIAGLVINTLCLSLTNPQSIRKSILVTSPLVLIYDAFVLSIGAVVYESVAIIYSVIGILRYRKQKEA
jgi:hypothetical protein